ncbi:hypothetical protein ACL02S_06170 [Nocardia sp. 004]|uniref:Rv0361 family membrane protein n=1 Tax=Nocardia sp. 004 TaxID=3385978 RepID=UPI0039A0CA0E
MTEQQPSAGEDENIRIDQTDKPSVAPFLAAAAVALVVLIAIVLGMILSPTEKNVTDADRIAAAVHNFIEGTNRTGKVPPPGTACQTFDADRVPLAGQLGGGKSVQITKIDGTVVEGDTGKTTVTTETNGTEQTTVWSLIRSDGTWLVCT